MTHFRDSWLASSHSKGSILCAGLDPAEFNMGRGEKGLGEGVNKREWALEYLEAVAPYCAAVKPNLQYWKNGEDMRALKEIAVLAHQKGLVTILDSKIADIGSTNEAGIYYEYQKGYDALTMAPYAGNMEETKEYGERWGTGLFTMCLMSNPEYESVKNELVDVNGDEEGYEFGDLVEVGGKVYVKKYINLARRAAKCGIEGIVIGAPSEDNHISEEELAKARAYSRDDTLVLMPGVGAQGGDARTIFGYFDSKNVVVNVGRGLMFPKEKSWADTAKEYRDMLNDLRV